MDGLLERGAALEALEAAFEAAAAGDGRVLVVTGAAGLGKTALLAGARERAAARSLNVLAATGSEIEREVPFGLVLQLLEAEARRDPGAVLAGAAALAAPLLLGGVPGIPAGLEHGLWWACQNLAAQRPLALLVDDAHWGDDASLRALAYAATRLGDAPIALVCARRPAGAAPSALDRLAGVAATVELAPLSPAAIAEVVRVQSRGAASESLVRACAEATGGNPFLLHALLDHLGSGGDLEARAPGAVARWVRADLDRAGPGGARLAEAAAVLGDDALLRRAAALAGLGTDAAAAAADALAAAGVLRPPAATEPLRFSHPLVRQAAYEAQPAARRAADHLRAARALADEGARVERIAAQLLRAPATGDPWVAETLSAAAAVAHERGAPEAAARQLARALEEPPPAAARLGVLRDLARAEAAAGLPGAAERLERALELAADGRLRCEVLEQLGDARFARGDAAGAAEAYDSALAGAASERDRRRLLARYAAVAMLDAGLAAPARERVGAIVAQPPERDGPEDRVLLATLAIARAYALAPVGEVRELARRALAGGTMLREETADGPAVYAALGASTWAEDYDATVREATAALADAAARGSFFAFANASNSRAAAHLYAGRVGDALADALQAFGAWRHGWESFLPVCALLAVTAHAERGEPGAARAIADRLDPRRWAGSAMLGFVHHARGVAAAAAGDLDAAAGCFAAVGETFDGVSPNPVILDWRGRRAAALADRSEAIRLAEEEVALARRFGAPRPLGSALRALGAVRHGADAIATLEEAVAVLDPSPSRLDLARALVELGAALRRDGRRAQAREPLAAGRELAHRCGATALERRALDEQRAAGMRPRRPARSGADSLSPSELRVAGMAAAGQTNREIAQALFVTPKAVEWHLTNAYRKLGVRSRRDLSRVLSMES